jgi:uncharacterized membrane protein YfcA
MYVPLPEFIVLIVLIFFQSIFGIGLLVFGTPSFLLFGYSFEETLSIIVPLSCLISFLQILYSKENVKKFTKDFISWAIFPLLIFMAISLFLISLKYLKFLISIIMIIISLLNLYFSSKFKNKFFFKKYRKIYLVIIGSIHGLTNLGGGLISIFSTLEFDKFKIKSRKAIAISYLLFGSFQILVLLLTNKFEFNVFFIILLIFIPPIFFISNKIFLLIPFRDFKKIINITVLIYGMYLFFI